jgi:hypothetical protein
MHEHFDQPDTEVSMGNFLERPFRDADFFPPLRVHGQVKEQGNPSIVKSRESRERERGAFILVEATSLFHTFRTRIDLLFMIASQLESRGTLGDVETVTAFG